MARLDAERLAAWRELQSVTGAIERQIDADLVTERPQAGDVAGFDAFLRRYLAALPVQRAAVECT